MLKCTTDETWKHQQSSLQLHTQESKAPNIQNDNKSCAMLLMWNMDPNSNFRKLINTFERGILKIITGDKREDDQWRITMVSRPWSRQMKQISRSKHGRGIWIPKRAFKGRAEGRRLLRKLQKRWADSVYKDNLSLPEFRKWSGPSSRRCKVRTASILKQNLGRTSTCSYEFTEPWCSEVELPTGRMGLFFDFL